VNVGGPSGFTVRCGTRPQHLQYLGSVEISSSPQPWAAVSWEQLREDSLYRTAILTPQRRECASRSSTVWVTAVHDARPGLLGTPGLVLFWLPPQPASTSRQPPMPLPAQGKLGATHIHTLAELKLGRVRFDFRPYGSAGDWGAPDAEKLLTGIKQGIADSHFQPPIEGSLTRHSSRTLIPTRGTQPSKMAAQFKHTTLSKNSRRTRIPKKAPDRSSRWSEMKNPAEAGA